MSTSKDLKQGCFIDGKLVHGSGQPLRITSPWNRATIKTISSASDTDVSIAVESSANAFEEWSNSNVSLRLKCLKKLALLLDAHAEEIASLQVKENGKLYKEMLDQAKLFGDHLRYYASLLNMPSGYTITPPSGGIKVQTERHPLGVVAAITPWNSPINLLLWKIGPALATGNTVVAKPSEITPLSTLKLAELATAAGFPDGVFNIVTGAEDVGIALVEHPKVSKIAFTGSSSAGEKIASAASKGLRRLSLELGDKSANIVFADSNTEQALNGVLAGIFGASGQTCMAGSRILIEASIFEEFKKSLVKAAKGIRLGDPFQASTDMGPIATPSQLNKIETMVSRATSEGATISIGGARATLKDSPDGLFYLPTLLSDVTTTMEIFNEEVFGPVGCLIPFRDTNEAVELANSTKYGLAAGIWTENYRKALNVASQLQAGTVWINNYRKVAFNIPFGGMCSSGLNRENGPDCFSAYTEEKAIWVDEGLGVSDPFNPRG